jgi:hypothetical protein
MPASVESKACTYASVNVILGRSALAHTAYQVLLIVGSLGFGIRIQRGPQQIRGHNVCLILREKHNLRNYAKFNNYLHQFYSSSTDIMSDRSLRIA